MVSHKILPLCFVICLAFVYVNARPGNEKSSSDYEHQDHGYEHEHEHEHQPSHEHEHGHQPPHEHDKNCGHPIKEGVEKIKTIVKNAIDQVKKTVKDMLPPPPSHGRKPGYEGKDKPAYPEGDKKLPYPYPPEEEKEYKKPSKKPEYDNPDYVIKPQGNDGFYTEQSKVPVYHIEESSKKEYEVAESHPQTIHEGEEHKEYKGGFANH